MNENDNTEVNKKETVIFATFLAVNAQSQRLVRRSHFSLKNWVGWSVGSKNIRDKCFFLIFLLTRLTTPRIPEDKHLRASLHDFVLVKVKKSMEKA